MIEIIACILLLTSFNIFAFSTNIPALDEAQVIIDLPRRKADIVQRKTNFCELQEQVEKGNVDLRHALRNLNIFVGVQDYVVNRNTGDINENYIAVKVFEEVANRAQFNWRDTIEVIDPPSQNETWSDVLTRTTSKCDLALDFWTRTPERLSMGETIPQAFMDTSVIMIQMKKSDEKDLDMWHLLFKPFTWEVWLLILFTMIISGLVYYLIDFITYRGNKAKIGKTVNDSVFFSFQVLTGTSKYNPTHAPNRILLLSLRGLCIIIVAAFTSNLTVFLMDDISAVTIKVFEDAIHSNYRICLMRGYTDNIKLQKLYPTGLYVEKDNQLQMYQGLHEGECEILLDDLYSFKSLKNKIEYNPNCKLEWIETEITSSKKSFAIKASEQVCSSLLRDVLNLHLVNMTMDNTLERITEDVQNVNTNNCNSVTTISEYIQLTIPDICGVFVFYALVVLFSVVSSILLRIKHPKDLPIAKRVNETIEAFSIKFKESNPDEAQDNAKEDECSDIIIKESTFKKMMVAHYTDLKNELKEELDNTID